MARTQPSQTAARHGRHFGKRFGVAASLGLHVVVLAGVVQAPWAESPAAPNASQALVWAAMRPPPPDRPPLSPEREPEPVTPPAPETAEPPADHASVPAPPPEPPKRTAEPAPQPIPAAEAPRSAERGPQATEASEPVRNDAPAPRPRIDWEKERREAIASVIREHSGEGVGTFTPGDRAEPRQPLPIEPAPPPLEISDCTVAKGFNRFLAQMTGRCVIDEYPNLFAAIKPTYLRARPVCRETQPDSPGAVTSTGEVISTVKCELVVEDDE